MVAKAMKSSRTVGGEAGVASDVDCDMTRHTTLRPRCRPNPFGGSTQFWRWGCASGPGGHTRSFFVNLPRLYSGCRGNPAMAINGRRNKPIGPGGSTRRLHQNPSQWMAFGGAEIG